jgi:hypothetical protein
LRPEPRPADVPAGVRALSVASTVEPLVRRSGERIDRTDVES